MAKARLRFLEKDEEELIHALSLKNLNEMGVLIHSEMVLKMLDEAGADVDHKKQIAKIPEAMVNDAIKKAPKSITLGARDPERDLKIPVQAFPFISSCGVTVFIIDHRTGQRREATRKDLAELAKVGDALDPLNAFWPMVTTSDVTPNSHMVHELWTSMQNTTKHILGSAGSGTIGIPDAKTQIALGRLVAGGEKELKKRPLFSVLSCVIAPLSFERGSVEAQVEYAKAGIPVISMSMTLGGMTAPATVAGTIVNANTENLASLVITQTAEPGAPHIYSTESTLVNMTSGVIDYRGAETPLIMAATGAMASRYGLPKMTGAIGVDADRPGNPVPFGETLSIWMTTMSGTDLASGAGGIDSDRGCSAVQLVCDVNFWEDFRAFMRDFSISEEKAALDLVKEIGHNNTFLTHPHTAKNFKKEIFFRDRKKTELYGATASDRMVPDAKKTVETILKSHQVESIDKDLIRRGDEIVKEFEKSV